MSPSNSTVVRFCASYGQGFEFPVRRLILGYGYQDDGGLSHRDILATYLGSKILNEVEKKVYAGYLRVEQGRIQIFSGGSQTLRIPRDEHKSQKLLEDLESLNRMHESVVNLFPLITGGSVYHVMLA